MDKKDEIIGMQLELIRSMTENNIRRLGEDIWGRVPPKNGNGEPKKDSPASPVGDKGGAAVSTGDTGVSPGKDAVPEEEPEKLEDLMAELDGYIGLGNVKREVRALINMAKVYKMRRDNDLPVSDTSLHMVFSGNPGTGKTMIARFMARVYRSIGLLSKGQLVETDRGGLVAGYIGQTAIKTGAVLEKALGGVLFIDEAYGLTNKSENDFGGEAVDTVLKYMEDHRDDIVVIVAGYTELMEDFIESNPGLRSRFNKYVEFDDYTGPEMADIFRFQCKKGCYEADEDAMRELEAYFDAAAEFSADFGNARGVRNTFEKVLSEQANRLAEAEEVTKDDLMKITGEDVRAALYPDAENIPEKEEE
ncbi:MAG: AAA family ATPase [Clostridia bacterium]|nr:AAA family ATPase [Clostridia bacterium]